MLVSSTIASKKQDVANHKNKAIQIDLEDLFNYKDLDEDFLRRVTENTRRYIGIFAEAIDELIPEPTDAFPDDDHDILMTQSEVYSASSKGQPFTIREVKASYIGQLVKISGIVTRCSDVKPLMQVAVYTCEECGFEIYQVAPSDVVELSGIFLPIPYTGFRAMRAGLVAETYLEAMSVSHFKKNYEEYELKGDEEEQIVRLAEDGDIYNKLAQSLVPGIFGPEDIKKALLLLLVGAPHQKLKDEMTIRGDLHICLMVDPGVAKSQLLEHIINVAPRGVYSKGKGSSGVGLTAAAQKDPVTNEMVLEGGALVLADLGICAIDEFDKMDDSDRPAIHEVMEQQTVSIAKAGITTSLNARTLLLQIQLGTNNTYSLQTRAYTVIPIPSPQRQSELARHVVYVHQNKESPALGFTPLDPSVLRAYISAARKLCPCIPKDLEEYIATAYSGIQQDEAKSNTPHSYTTVRTLLSILRKSAALARLRFSDTVAQSDVDEALRLMQMSKFSL
ncbi:minichromosome maintenance (MCM2/3/5) family protein [Actinidia rufa]|uniref:DNA replication licensing factor MCM7 n=1 Tax=Actinidia rufa TaxID=165716 RepID=A0A7J0GSL9_9ERIC|nr:minichromosome maintenance (MCM2/3/5) family protein [Actinidia rufa]